MAAPNPADIAALQPQQVQDYHSLQQPEEHLVVDHTSKPHGRTVLLALDASTHSQYAFGWVQDNLLRPDDLVVLVSVRPVPALMSDIRGDIVTAVTEIEDAARQASHRLLQHYGVDLKQKGFNVRAFAIRGDPRTEIVRKAIEMRANLLVMGSRGLGPIKRAFVGSVSDYVVHNAPCAVLVVRPEDEVSA
ncbi:hypothetical protein RI367_008073 [Sorochytrium milnesiophthora]